MRLGITIALLAGLLSISLMLVPVPDLGPNHRNSADGPTRPVCLALTYSDSAAWAATASLDTVAIYTDTAVVWYMASSDGTPYYTGYVAWRPLANDSLELIGHGGWIARLPGTGDIRTGSFRYERSQPYMTAILTPALTVSARETPCRKAAV